VRRADLTSACIRAQVDEEDDDDMLGIEDPEALYSLTFGDTVPISKSNWLKMKDFNSATNHTRLDAEVKKARELTKKNDEEVALMQKNGITSREVVVGWVGDLVAVPESEVRIMFQATVLGKKKVTLWSVKEYKHAVKGKGKGKAATTAAPPTHEVKRIEHVVDLETWVEMVKRVDAAPGRENPAEERDADVPDCVREKDTALDTRKRDGLMQWCDTMINLSNMEVYALNASTARTDSNDPKATLHAKIDEIKGERQRRAEIHSAAADAKRLKEEEKERAAQEMRDRSRAAWDDSSYYRHEGLHADDAKNTIISKVVKSVRGIEKELKGLRVPREAELPSLQQWLADHDLSSIFARIDADGWDLRTLLNTARQTTFEGDFVVLPTALRRRFRDALVGALEELQPPPTPSPPKRKRRPPPSTYSQPSTAGMGSPQQSVHPEDFEEEDHLPDDTRSVFSARSGATACSGRSRGQQSQTSL
jgi:hypothetical protein